jgi:micrococcal nuclease
MKKPYGLITLLILSLLLLPPISISGQIKVIRIVEGDTLVIDYKGAEETVRLLYVNTPEPVYPNRRQNVPMGELASNYTQGRLYRKHVVLEFEDRRRGNYGRLHAYLFVDGRNFNLELIRKGLSPYVTKNGRSRKYHTDFREAERYARNHGLGIWKYPGLSKKYLKLKSEWGKECR